ncbi:MAG TPA: ABC transporter substrate-binding protein [Vicinamibacteria bacterium]|nr:ABC transporter substrate-binding protein [Vicinamibacteria bacterium]
MASRASAVLLAWAALASLACPRGEGERPPAAVGERVAPLVVPPAEIRAGGALAIAAVFPTMGRYAVSGVQSLQGARIAVEELNANGGVNGRPLRLAAYRMGSYFVDAREAAAQAIRAGALAIVGANSSELSQAVAEEAEANGILQVTNVSTAADLTWEPQSSRTRPFVFRMCATDDVMGDLLAGFARDRLHARRVAVLYEVGRPYSQRLARSFVARFSDDVAGHAVAKFSYLTLETDFRPQLELIRKFRPDVLFVPGSFQDATLVSAQAVQVGLHVTMLGGDAWSSPLLFQRGGPPGEAYYVELCSPTPEFDRRYEATVGEEPPGCRAVLAYDAVRVIVAGLRSLGPLSDDALDSGLAETRRRLRDAVARNRVDGATGRIRFDVHGDRRQGVALYSVEKTPVGPPRALVRGWLGEP